METQGLTALLSAFSHGSLAGVGNQLDGMWVMDGVPGAVAAADGVM